MKDISEVYQYKEIQKFRQKWLFLIVLLIMLPTWWGFIRQNILGDLFGINPASYEVMIIIFILFGIGLSLFILTYRMTTLVTANFIVIKMTLLGKRLIRLSDIKRCYVRKYRPVLEYGGWGWSPTLGRAYIVTGNTGVQLELKNGKKILIGSQQAEKLTSAISSGF